MSFTVFKSDGIWQYYLRNGDVAKCKTCNNVLKCTGGSTKGLHTHQQAIHGVEVKNLKRNLPDIPSSSSPVAIKRKITDFYFVESQNTLPAILSRLTALDGLPFSIFIKSPDLRRCLNAMGFKDLPQSANTVRQMVFNYAKTLKDALRDEIQKSKLSGSRFSVTLDEWTSQRNRRYLNLNLHGFNGTPYFYCLGLLRINGSYSAEKCIESVDLRLKEFGLCLEHDIVNLTTDGCAMMIKVGKILDADGPSQQLCIAHGIQLGITDTLYKKHENFDQSDSELKRLLSTEY